MKTSDFQEYCEQYIEAHGLANTVDCLAEIARNRGNVEREDGGDLRAARLWTWYGSILFNAVNDIDKKPI